MDQRLNPYTPGSGVKPLKLAGRDPDLEAFRVLLEKGVLGAGVMHTPDCLATYEE